MASLVDVVAVGGSGQFKRCTIICIQVSWLKDIPLLRNLTMVNLMRFYYCCRTLKFHRHEVCALVYACSIKSAPIFCQQRLRTICIPAAFITMMWLLGANR